MSFINNRNTLEHYLGRVWLTKPGSAAVGGDALQSINICVEDDGDFVAIGNIQLASDGIYQSKGKPIGRREDAAFQLYIEKLAGSGGKNEADLFQHVCDCYAFCGDMAAVAKALDLSEERVRRILITTGAYTDDLVSTIAWLHDKGKGKTVAEIADMLKMKPNMVRMNMAYEKNP